MLTPVDIQQKRFHIGIGYDKKDVNAFFESVVESYEQLYRSNAELKEKVITLTDGLQNYKSKEASLKKSLMLAEKDSEDTKSKATKEAKTIELEAKAKAKAIIGDAEERLEAIKLEMATLETQYAAYKSNFLSLMKQQHDFLKSVDFDKDAAIDPRALTLLGGNAAATASTASNQAAFGSFDGDPQMRDQSTLGGMNGASNAGGLSMNPDDKNSTSAVYTAHLGENDNFVDPFNPNKNEPGRYNPYDGRQPETSKATKTNFTVNTNPGSKSSRSRRPQQKPQTESASTPNVEPKATYTSASEAKAKPETKPETKPEEKKNEIPTVSFNYEAESKKSDTKAKDENELVGDVEVNFDEKNLIGDNSSDDTETDEFGFEFV